MLLVLSGRKLPSPEHLACWTSGFLVPESGSPPCGAPPRPAPPQPGIFPVLVRPRSGQFPPRAFFLVFWPGGDRRPVCPEELRWQTRRYFVASFGRVARAAAGTQPRQTLGSKNSSSTSAEVRQPQF
ncbi:endogenous retroviral envelope protein HEMO isoform X2 [Macaca fascicularis]|uniref:endogenous retroviral envelope protein HEMO isoform X2 n=1 Tax=Macaca fascicularis TaxID=9541 RepID=UPI003D157BC1